MTARSGILHRRRFNAQINKKGNVVVKGDPSDGSFTLSSLFGCGVASPVVNKGVRLYFRPALESREKQALNSLTIATSCNNIGAGFWKQGKLEEALEQFRLALEIEEGKAPNSLDVATFYNNIGTVLNQQGKLEDALEHYRRALEIREEKAPNSLDLASSYMSVAEVYKKKGQLAFLEQYRRATSAPVSLTFLAFNL
jgi:Tfp pilus assembly protein PilF